MSTISTPSVATYDAERRRIVLPALPLAEWKWAGSLPDGRRNKDNVWSCLATPVACWRVASKCECDYFVQSGADRFVKFTRCKQDSDWIEQPRTRLHDLWRHQIPAYGLAVLGKSLMLSMAMGTGKSIVVVSLVENLELSRTLILCPKSVVAVWPREFAKHSVHLSECVVTFPDKELVAKRAKKLAWHIDHAERLVAVVNYDSCWRESMAEVLLSCRWDLVACDESHRIKGANTNAGKFAYKVGRQANRRLCLTGTPMPHSPLDIFGQYRFLDAGIFGTSYHAFQKRYCTTDPQFPSKVWRWENQDELAKRMGLIMYEVKSEVLDLPESTHQTIDVELSPSVRKIYKQIEEQCVAELGSGEITVANAAVKLLRLQQITGGHIGHEEGPTVFDQQDKAEALADVLEDIREPVVVFCRFRCDMDAVRKVTESLGRRYGELSGRANDLDRGQFPADRDVMGVQIQSGSAGVDLTRASLCIYFSVGFSLGDYLQSMARVLRPGQRNNVRYLHLVASNTVDEYVYKALDKRANVVEEVMNKLRGR